jgi:hypothetical protein
MKALRFAASVLIIGAILALYRTLLPVNNTTVALTLRRSGGNGIQPRADSRARPSCTSIFRRVW